MATPKGFHKAFNEAHARWERQQGCEHKWGPPKQVEFGVREKQLWWRVTCQNCSLGRARPTYAELQEAISAKSAEES